MIAEKAKKQLVHWWLFLWRFRYDLVLDCTDNAATRYLLNDACVLSNRPLVSGSALRFEGQLTVYHLNGGPCYRCIFPRPVAKAMVTNCSDGGVIGAVPGTIGSLQALEAIKILTGTGGEQLDILFTFIFVPFGPYVMWRHSPSKSKWFHAHKMFCFCGKVWCMHLYIAEVNPAH